MIQRHKQGGKNLFSTDLAINRTKLRDGLDMQILDRDFEKILLH